MKEILENFASSLTAATVALLLFSVLHEYGYFLIVGSRFQSFVTTSDYFSNAMLWLPLCLFFVLMFYLWDNRIARFRKRFQGRVIGSVLLTIGGLIIIGIQLFSYQVIPFLVVWIPVFYWTWAAPQLWPEYEGSGPAIRLMQYAFAFVPAIGAVFFALGVTDGTDDLRSVSEPYLIELKSAQRPVPRLLLRSFDKGVLVRDATEGRVEFIKWDDLTKLSRLTPAKPKSIIMCRWFGRLCTEPAPTR